MNRDPLWWDLLAIFEATEEREEDWKAGGRVDQLKQSIELKYELLGICSPKHAWKFPELHILNEETRRYTCWIPSMGRGPVSVTVLGPKHPGFALPLVSLGMTSKTMIPHAHLELAQEPQTHDDEISHPDTETSAEPPKSPRLLLEVELGRVGAWDLAFLGNEFLGIIREALKRWKKGWSEPPELGSLRYMRPETFPRDLRRYDLHMTHGLSFRLIALGESLERQGKRIHPRRKRVGHPVREESSVADSVHRIYRAVYRKPYNAKRRRIDTPAVGFPPYSCAAHPDNSCDADCKQFRDWWKRIKPTLPSDMTGLLWKIKIHSQDEIDVMVHTPPDGRHKRPLPTEFSDS